jgi:competence protein ComEC
VRPFLSDTGDTVDYPRILQAQNIHTVLQSSDVIKKESVSSIRSWSVRITSELATVLQTAMSEPASGLGRGIALGERQALSAHDEELFRTTGLSHIVVFSGSNVALIVICLWFLLGMFSTTSRVIVICSSVWCVIAAIGFDPPAVRAGIMATIVLLTQSIGKHAAVLEVFFATVILMLIYNPFQLLFDVSFQLSALAVLSLITLAPLSYEVLSKKVPKVLAFALSLHISVTLLVSPLLLYTFGTFSVVSVLANILVAPLVPLALCMTLATAVLGFTLPSVVPIFAIPTELVLYAIYRIAETLASVPHASMALGSVSLPAVCLWYLGVLCVYLMTRNVRQLQTS